ncbi:histidyl-tRNA synthetase, putative [Theileria equi strain WA]|uniref:histidine--tRNA ligase n=1 Tax=Theileria equi strain WA TaxID=1537102 RepID=L0B029_THEEQ|nr:histidyl-tRNA synthetase, putative [Theileria equi strain WA]AFZ80479.1 histidyl-tRNA synthetase, putative [Theileria equi strain WA]|eukprot:XP_004830145.1 histidyl-tRNA synthetase, putative [Theileria equi strain WA]
MATITLDATKVLSIDDLLLVGLSKSFIAIESELAKKIGLDSDIAKLNVLSLHPGSDKPDSPSDRDSILARMICCCLLQQALRYKPHPNPVLIGRLVSTLNTREVYHFRSHISTLHHELFKSQSPGVVRFLSTVLSQGKVASDEPSLDSVGKDLGISSDELTLLTKGHTEVLSTISVLGSSLKLLSNFSDCNLGIAFESLSVSTDFLSTPGLRNVPQALETARNLLWLTEDSKIIPKKSDDQITKSLISRYLVANSEVRNTSISLLKEVSRISTALYGASVSNDIQKVLDNTWEISLQVYLNGLQHSLDTVVSVYKELVPIMISKLELAHTSAIANPEISEALASFDFKTVMSGYLEWMKKFGTEETGFPKVASISSLEKLSKEYNDLIVLSSSISINILTIKEVSDAVTHKAKADSSKKAVTSTQKKIVLGHGNILYKDFMDKLFGDVFSVQRGNIMEKMSILQGHHLFSHAPEFEKILLPQNQKTRKPKLPKGTLDFLPSDVLLRSIVINSIKDVFRQHGAVETDTPVFELKETLVGKYGEDQKLIFDLKDQGGEQLSLRYDLTVPFARFVASNKIEKIKRFQIGKVYRRDEPQLARGRYREFVQCDLDFAGEYPKMVADSEVIFILVRVLRMIKKDKFVIKINHRGILDCILSFCGAETSLHRTICSSIDKLDKLPWEDVQNEMVHEKGLPEYVALKIKDFTEVNGTFEHVISFLKEKKIDTMSDLLDDMALLSSYLDAFGVTGSEVCFDLSLARGLDYYTGIIFEAVLIGEAVGSVGGGGRYDGLIGMFSGRCIPSIGLSVGIERIMRTLSYGCSDNLTDVYVCTVGDSKMLLERMKICALLWEHGIKAEYLYNASAGLRKQIDAALDKRVSVAIILGESELEAGVVKLKILNYDTEEKQNEITVPRKDLVDEIKSILLNRTKYGKILDALFIKS